MYPPPLDTDHHHYRYPPETYPPPAQYSTRTERNKRRRHPETEICIKTMHTTIENAFPSRDSVLPSLPQGQLNRHHRGRFGCPAGARVTLHHTTYPHCRPWGHKVQERRRIEYLDHRMHCICAQFVARPDLDSAQPHRQNCHRHHGGRPFIINPPPHLKSGRHAGPRPGDKLSITSGN